MKYPYISEIQQTRDVVDVFGGLNHTSNTQRGEFYNMKNMSSDSYPMLSPRKPRKAIWNAALTDAVFGDGGKVTGMFWKDGLWITGYGSNGGAIVSPYDWDGVTASSRTAALNGYDKTFVHMGAYVIVFPDKVWINTASGKQYTTGNMEAENVAGVSLGSRTNGMITFTPVAIDGDVIQYDYKQTLPPAMPKDQAYWLDTSGKTHTLKQYVSATSMWVSVATSYVRIMYTPSYGVGTDAPELYNPGAGMEVGDTVRITGLPTGTGSTLEDGDYNIIAKDSRSITIIGLIDEEYNTADNASLFHGDGYVFSTSRKVPDMEFVTESGNRLWGCHYGKNEKGENVNEIYASKLGDFKNWHVYSGVSTDSYAVSLGSDGAFTGATTYNGSPVFFKERCLHRVYGTMPSNFQMQTIECRGVATGSSKSLAIVNEILYYKGTTSICAYDGSIPVECGAALGKDIPGYAVGAAYRDKYYVNIEGSGLYAYDSAKGMWHREDTIIARSMTKAGDDMLILTGDSTILSVSGGGDELVTWMAESGIIGFTTPYGNGLARLVDRKYVSRILVRMSLVPGGQVDFFIDYDSHGSWEHIATMDGTSIRSFSVPIRPRRCDHFRIRIEGKGEAKIYSISKTLEQGSDLG